MEKLCHRQHAKKIRHELHLRRQGFAADEQHPLGCHFIELKKQEALELLGFSLLPTQTELKKRYFELSRKWHPDRPGGDVQKFKQLAEAFRFISLNAAL